MDSPSLRVSLCLLCFSASGCAVGEPDSSATVAPNTALPATASKGLPAWIEQSTDAPFDVKQFLASREPPTDNAAELYEKAFQEFDRAIDGVKPTTLRSEIDKHGNLEKLTSGEYSSDLIDNLLKTADPVITLVDAAQEKPKCVFVTGIGPDALMPHAQAARALARLCVLQVYSARNHGDFELAERAIKRGLRVSRDLQLRGHEVCQLVSIAIDTTLFGAIERLTIQDSRLTAEQCDRILSLLQEHPSVGLNRVAEGICMQYLMLRTAIEDHRDGRLTIDQIFDCVGAKAEGDESSNNWRINHAAEIDACNRIFSLTIPASKERNVSSFNAARNEVARIQADAKAKIAARSKADLIQVPYLMLVLAGPIGVLDDADRSSRAYLAGLQMLIALNRYEIQHGSLPNSLNEAAAETSLKSIPIDPYADAPLKYAIIEGKPTIYSIGKDLKDDGGKIDWKSSTQPGDFLFVLTS